MNAIQRILSKNFQEIIKEKRYIKNEEINNNISKGLEILKKDINLDNNFEVIQPLLSIINESTQCNVKSVSLAFSSLQQLIIQNKISGELLSSLVESMIQLLSTEEYGNGLHDDAQNHTIKEDIEQIHVKFLQMNLMILFGGKTQYNQNLLAKILALFFRMHRTKGLNESQTAHIGVQQITTYIFDTLARANQIENQIKNEKEDSRELISSIVNVAKSAFLYISDLTQIMKNNEASWMKIKKVDSCLAAELIELILTQYPQQLLIQEDFVHFLNETFPSVLIQLFQNSQKYELIVRLFRISSALTQLISEPQLQSGCFTFLESLVEITKDNSAPIWKKVLAFEVFRKICKDHELLRKAFNLKEENSKYSTDLLNKICLSVRFFIEKSLLLDNTLQEFQHSANQFKRLEKEATLTNMFQTTIDECIANCIDCLMGLIESMSIISLNSKNDEKELTLKICSNMIECSWPSILVSLSTLLESCNREDTVNTVLRAYLLIIDTCSISSKNTARDAFLTNLCKFSPTSKTLQSMNEESNQIILSKKSILAAQTLVDVAQGIGEQLGESWEILLQSFSDLNEFLIDYQKYIMKSRNLFSSELKNITRSMESLLNSTEKYSEDNLFNTVAAFCRFHTIDVNSESGLFIAAQLLIIVKNNISRVHVVWEVLQNHLLRMVEHENALIRQQGISDIFSIIHEFFSSETSSEKSSSSEDEKLKNNESQNDNTQEISKKSKKIKDHIELDIFTLFLTVSSSTHTDTKQIMIENLTTVIEQYGELITTAWSIILTVLRSTDCGSKSISIAFKSVQLIGANIRYLSTDGLLEYMKTIEYFATRRVVDDFNISLVAISLLWNLSDFMVKSTLKERKMDLFISLFTSLRKCVIDPRPEVRNAAVRTLLFAIASHGAELDVDAWENVVHKVLIPVLNDMQVYSNKADRKEMNSEAKQNNVYIHHSRNTEAKQWSETNCLAIENISRVVKEHSELLIQVPGFLEEGCKSLIGFIQASFEIHTSEIARVIISSMFDIFSSVKCEIRRILWDGLWSLWTKFVEDGCSGEKYVSNTLLLQLIESFTNLYIALLNEDFLTHSDILELIELAKKVLFSKYSANIVSHPSPCQKAVLLLLNELSGFSDAIREEIFTILSSFIEYIPTLKIKEIQDPMHIEVASSILQTIVDDIFVGACNDLQIQLFVRLMNILGALTISRFSSRNDYDLWKISVDHFIKCVKLKIESFVTIPATDVDSFWNSILVVIEGFLFPVQGTQLKLLEKGQQEELKIMQLINTTLLQNSESASNEVKLRILSILEKSSHTAPRNISHEAIQILFKNITIASELLLEKERGINLNLNKESQIIVGILAAPKLFNRCKEIIQRYISDDEQSGEMPLPSYRRQEMLNIFQHLKEQKLHTSISESLPNNNSKLSKDIMNGPKGMAIRLFPLLSQFTRSNIQDPALKSLLCDLLSILSIEFGFSI